MEKIAEILYVAYRDKYRGKGLMTDEHEKCFTKVLHLLPKQHSKVLYDLELHYLNLLIKHEKRAIQYVLELVEPDY